MVAVLVLYLSCLFDFSRNLDATLHYLKHRPCMGRVQGVSHHPTSHATHNEAGALSGKHAGLKDGLCYDASDMRLL